MKKFLKRLLVFVLPVFIGSGIFHWVITSTLKKSQQGDLGVWNELVQGKIDAQMLIYGSSRAWVNFDTHILEDSLKRSVYNLGGDGYDFNLQRCRHDLITMYNQKPDTIIVALDYFMFTKRELLPNPAQFLPTITDPIIQTSIEPYHAFDFWDVHLPVWRYVGYSNSIVYAGRIFLNPTMNKPDRYHGYAGQNRTWTSDLDKAKSRAAKHEQKIDTALVHSFSAFLHEAQQSGTKVIFVYPPEYIEGQQYVVNREKVFGLFDSLAHQHNVDFFDYSSDSISFDKSYFYNSQHLNKQGAEAFTRKLASRLTRR